MAEVIRGLASNRGAAVSVPGGVIQVHDAQIPTQQVSLLVSSAFPASHHTTIALLIYSPDHAAHYHILPANPHSTIAVYPSLSLTRDHIITFPLLITIPPLLYTHLYP